MSGGANGQNIITNTSCQTSTLVVPKWPHIAQLQQWIIQLGKNLVESSNKTDHAEIAWINECKDKEFEQLADSGGERFKKLDNKLAAVIHRAYRDEELSDHAHAGHTNSGRRDIQEWRHDARQTDREAHSRVIHDRSPP